MNQTINKLKSSPLFNLSLSSKELFHSNFLFWLGQNYPNEFGLLFRDYITKKTESSSITHIFREKENIDLSFVYSNNQEILVENKVKSIPCLKQLKEYSEKNPNKNYLLLSLSEPLFFSSQKTLQIGDAIWHYLSYSELKDKLRIAIDGIENSYHRQIVEDYLLFIEGLVEVNSLCQVGGNDLFDFHSLDNNTFYNSLKDIRLHDFYQKKKYELLAFEVYRKLKESNNYIAKLVEFGEELNWESQTPLIYTGFGMARGVGLMDMKYLVAENLTLGIQIQGEHYRMVVEDNNGQIAHRIKEELDNDYWFDLSRSFPNEKVYPNITRGFNAFGKSFFYKSVKLGSNKSVNEVVEFILKDVELINSNLTEIQRLVAQVM